MELQKQLTSLELSKRLEKLDVPQKSYFWWIENDSPAGGSIWELSIYPPQDSQEGCSAYTVAELGEMIGHATSKNVLRAYGEVMNVQDTEVITPNGLVYCMHNPEVGGLILEYLRTNNLLSL